MSAFYSLSYFLSIGISFIQILLLYRIYRMMASRVPDMEKKEVFKSENIFGALFILIFTGMSTGDSIAADQPNKTNIAISNFSNDAGDSRCGFLFGGWQSLGHDLRDQLTTEISQYGDFKVLERKNLKSLYEEEHELINAKKSTLPKKNQFESAKYSITGAVTAFEMCGDGGGIGLDLGSLIGFGSFDVNAKRTNANVELNLRIIDVETGEVVKSFVSKGSSSATSVGLDAASLSGVKLNTGAFKNSPLGSATQEALKDAAKTIHETIKT